MKLEDLLTVTQYHKLDIFDSTTGECLYDHFAGGRYGLKLEDLEEKEVTHLTAIKTCQLMVYIRYLNSVK